METVDNSLRLISDSFIEQYQIHKGDYLMIMNAGLLDDIEYIELLKSIGYRCYMMNWWLIVRAESYGDYLLFKMLYSDKITRIEQV